MLFGGGLLLLALAVSIALPFAPANRLFSQETDPPASPAAETPGESDTSPPPETADSVQKAGAEVPDAVAPGLPPDRVINTDKQEAKSTFEKIDAGFAAAVAFTEKILFYRLGASQRPYIETFPEVFYIRDFGVTDDKVPFLPLNEPYFNRQTQETEAELTTDEIAALQARGRLIVKEFKAEGSSTVEVSPIRDGWVAGRDVQYVTIKTGKSQKYVGLKNAAGDTVYHLQLPLRERISENPEDQRTAAQVLAMAGRSELKLDNSEVSRLLLQVLGFDKAGKTSAELASQLRLPESVVLWQLGTLSQDKLVQESVKFGLAPGSPTGDDLAALPEADQKVFQALAEASPQTSVALAEQFKEKTHVTVERLLRLMNAKKLERVEVRWTLTESGQAAADRAGKDIAPAYRFSEQIGGAPVVVIWLAMGSLLFTLYLRGVNIWAFGHAIQVVMGKYDNPEEPGEVTHFQALSSALSATVGLGNISGVTIAMTLGGPGAFFWMLVSGLLGMTSKFVECTLGQKYRSVKEDGTVLGGPMQYLYEGLRGLGLGPLGLVLSILFAVMCVMASFGGGNMFQANQAASTALSVVQKGDRDQLSALNVEIEKVAEAKDFHRLGELQSQKTQLDQRMKAFAKSFNPVFGVMLAIAVGAVIIGGIKRIAAAASKVVPTMCLLYAGACMFIVLAHIAQVPNLIMLIFERAFSPTALGGGIVGVMVVGIQRAAFSNEAGVGSAAIAHSAAKTDEPVREGTVALLGPFIDTIIVCSMTALVILITGAWDNETWIVEQGLTGAALTTQAFETEISWFPYILGVAVVLFAYSTIISWSYYGERCWERLFGAGSILFYRFLYVGAVILGAIVNLGSVLDFSDMMILSMAFPNILGCLMLAPQVRRDLLDYWKRYRAGTFKTFK
ncbi:Amino-acid carrier protein AlsT [Lignipirellula cremea]|uniref:Amino-acid carrier protein AlsT n=2 Tax=Lignipirellula cremea TaxID=2528010 RepID=A0A518E036_9BACT|nr:Amino-acid carrier protein AlsT [Lignipirellula cremea]